MIASSENHINNLLNEIIDYHFYLFFCKLLSVFKEILARERKKTSHWSGGGCASSTRDISSENYAISEDPADSEDCTKSSRSIPY